MTVQNINIPRLLKWLDDHSAIAVRENSHTYAVRMAEAATLIRDAEDALRTAIDAAEARERQAVEALRHIAEGNLGPDPWQADYAKIKAVAAAAIRTGAKP